MTLKQQMATAAEKAIREALARHAGSKSAAADELGLSRSQLYRYLREYGITGGEPGRKGDGRFSPS